MTIAERTYQLFTGQNIADLTGLPDADPVRSGRLVAYDYFGASAVCTFSASDIGVVYGYTPDDVARLVALREAVGGRIYPNILPQGEKGLPAIIYRQTDNRPVNDFDGPAQMDMEILDVWIYAETRRTAQIVGNLLRYAFDGYRSASTQYIWYFNDSDDFDTNRETYIQHYEFKIARNRVAPEPPAPVSDAVFLTDDDGVWLTDNDGNFVKT